MAAGAPAAKKPQLQTPNGEMIPVDMAEVRVSVSLTDSLAAYGLGACIGVCLYDPHMRVAGLAHIVLPEQGRYSPGASAGHLAAASPRKFVDSAVPILVEDVCHSGGRRGNLVAAVVGGASIFGGAFSAPGAPTPSRLEIGERNVAALHRVLAELKIPLVASDVGGSHGRTVVLRVCDGAVVVKPIGGEAKVLTILNRASGEVRA